MPIKVLITWFIISLLIFASSAFCADVSTLLEKGIYAEETKGDLDEAMKIYQKIINENAGNSVKIAEAYYRLGTCYLKTGDEAKAIEMFKNILTGFRDHKKITSDARAQLVKLNALDEEYQIKKPLELGPVPWENGETCWYNVSTLVLENLGKMIVSIKDVTINGNDLWRIETYVIIPGERQSQFCRVDVLKKDFKPFEGFSKGVLGNKVKYEKDHIQIFIDSLGTKDTKEIPINNFVYDSNQVDLLLRRLPLNEGYSTSLSTFNIATGNIIKVEVRVTGIETVKVPAGTFECYCVELVMDSKMKVNFWISTDEKRYVAKYDLGAQGSVELEKIEQVSDDKPEMFKDGESGISMSAPDGWYIFKSSITGPLKMLLQIVLPELKAGSTFSIVQHFGQLPDSQNILNNIETMKQAFKNFTLRPESWTYGEIDGLPSSTFIADYDKKDNKMVLYRTYILDKKELCLFELQIEKNNFDKVKIDFDSLVHGFKRNKTYDYPVSTVLKHYKSPDNNFELDIPERWYTSPPDYNNSPNEVIRFGSQQGGSYILIVFRNPNYFNQTLKMACDQTQKILANGGFGNFITAETTIGSKDVITLDFDKPMGDGGTWSCRHYFIPDGNFTYVLGFGTFDKDGMIDLYDRVAKTFRTK